MHHTKGQSSVTLNKQNSLTLLSGYEAALDLTQPKFSYECTYYGSQRTVPIRDCNVQPHSAINSLPSEPEEKPEESLIWRPDVTSTRVSKSLPTESKSPSVTDPSMSSAGGMEMDGARFYSREKMLFSCNFYEL